MPLKKDGAGSRSRRSLRRMRPHHRQPLRLGDGKRAHVERRRASHDAAAPRLARRSGSSAGDPIVKLPPARATISSRSSPTFSVNACALRCTGADCPPFASTVTVSNANAPQRDGRVRRSNAGVAIAPATARRQSPPRRATAAGYSGVTGFGRTGRRPVRRSAFAASRPQRRGRGRLLEGDSPDGFARLRIGCRNGDDAPPELLRGIEIAIRLGLQRVQLDRRRDPRSWRSGAAGSGAASRSARRLCTGSGEAGGSGCKRPAPGTANTGPAARQSRNCPRPAAAALAAACR